MLSPAEPKWMRQTTAINNTAQRSNQRARSGSFVFESSTSLISCDLATCKMTKALQSLNSLGASPDQREGSPFEWTMCRAVESTLRYSGRASTSTNAWSRTPIKHSSELLPSPVAILVHNIFGTGREHLHPGFDGVSGLREKSCHHSTCNAGTNLGNCGRIWRQGGLFQRRRHHRRQT